MPRINVLFPPLHSYLRGASWAGLSVLLLSCGGGGSSPSTPSGGGGTPATNTIEVGQGGLMFVPNVLTVKVGTQVTFHWATSLNHSVVIGSGCTPSGALDTGVKSAGDSIPFPTTTVGDVPFFCRAHCGSGMTGVIHVTP